MANLTSAQETLRWVFFNDVGSMASGTSAMWQIKGLPKRDVFFTFKLSEITSRFVWRFRELRKRDEEDEQLP